MKKLLMPVMALLLIIQSGYLLAAADGDDYFKQASIAAIEGRWGAVYKLIDEGKVSVNERSALNERSLGGLPLIATAIDHNKLEDIQELLNRGAELNTQVWVLPLITASMRYLDLGDNINLMGLSFWGWLTSQYTLNYTERLNKAVGLASAAPQFELPGEWAWRGILSGLPHRFFMKNLWHKLRLFLIADHELTIVQAELVNRMVLDFLRNN